MEKIASDVYCLNVYKGDAFYAQSEDDAVSIKYRSFDGESEVELFTINPDENKSIKSLVVSDDFIIYDLEPEYRGDTGEGCVSVKLRIRNNYLI